MAMRDVSFAASSNIQSAAYDDETQELTIVFNHGGEYTYSAVTTDEVEQFSAAPSAGKFLNQYIKIPLHPVV
jgi:uncharacterized protein (UPF0248 family)